MGFLARALQEERPFEPRRVWRRLQARGASVKLSAVLTLGFLVAPAVSQGQLARATPAVEGFVRVEALASDPRSRTSINDGWRFRPDGLNFAEKPSMDDADWERVSIPHTWNASDPFDDAPSYRRGIGWYRKHLPLSEDLRGKRLYLYFEGANQVARVYVNGAFAGEHRGGYTAFAVDITRYTHIGTPAPDNVIAVAVDNSHDPFIPPLSVGYALYGGIYRDVWLIATDSVHIALNDHASSGVYISTPSVSASRGQIRTRGIISNESNSPKHLRVVNTVLDAAGRSVSVESSQVSALVGDIRWTQALPDIRSPHLWSPDDPYLYTVRTEVYERDVLRDRVTNPLGFRWFAFDANDGFSLNGRKLVLRGTNRHQDYQGLGSALPNRLHLRDMQWIKEMGANFVRLAHYPQDPAVLAAADSLGLLIWEEIPVVNYITTSSEFTSTSEEMLQDMIRQHHNHPSVIVWGLMNEVFLWSPEGARIGRQTDTVYMRKVRDLAADLNALAHREDPTRPSTMAIHQSGDYDRAGLSEITDLFGLNLYSGWYGGVFEGFGTALDRIHAADPKRVLFVSEYGAEDDARVNSLEPERFDFSGSWIKRFHESYMRQIKERPWLAGTALWNQFDFSQPETGGSIPYMNQKGMQRWDRTPKDVFYLYKANWNPSPMVYIASRGWTHRAGTNTAAAVGIGPTPVAQPVDVYSNLPSVELFANGKSLGKKIPDDVHRATWDVPFTQGDNRLEARSAGNGRSYMDSLVVHFNYRGSTLSDPSVPFKELGVNVGAKAQVADSDGFVWEGDQAYHVGSFGHVGGERKMFDKDLAIRGSAMTPLYFTYQLDLSSYRLDVPDGAYDLELLFAEPDAKPGARVFGVSVNGSEIESRLDLAARFGLARAALIRAITTASAGKGVVINFTSIQGQPILNALRIRRR